MTTELLKQKTSSLGIDARVITSTKESQYFYTSVIRVRCPLCKQHYDVVMGGRIIEHLEYSEQCLQKMKDYGIDINSLAEKATCATIAVSKIPKKKRTVHLWFQDGGSLYHFVLNQRKGLQRGLHNVIYVANELIKKEKAVNIGWKS
ncbi:MAG: hypothetical protein ACPLM9_06900 [Methanomassiliicoccales archaeon]